MSPFLSLFFSAFRFFELFLEVLHILGFMRGWGATDTLRFSDLLGRQDGTVNLVRERGKGSGGNQVQASESLSLASSCAERDLVSSDNPLQGGSQEIQRDIQCPRLSLELVVTSFARALGFDSQDPHGDSSHLFNSIKLQGPDTLSWPPGALGSQVVHRDKRCRQIPRHIRQR